MTHKSRNTVVLATLAGAARLALGIQAAVRLSRRIRFSGKNVLITGGSRGLGLVLARRFADEGANVAICARDEDELRRAQVAFAPSPSGRGLGVRASQEHCSIER